MLHTMQGLMGHTATLVGNMMYIIGGIMLNKDLHTMLFTYNISSSVWTTLSPTGVDGVFGHSANYVASSGLIYVYGGLRVFYSDTRPQRSNFFKAYSITTGRWTSLAPVTNNCPCVALHTCVDCNYRSMHTASLVGRYLVVFGGSSFNHNYDYSCASASLAVFDTGCGAWLPDLMDTTVFANMPMARLAHTAVVRNNAVTIVGGYSGTVLGDIYTYTLPVTYCSYHNSLSQCLLDAVCGWSNMSCYAIVDLASSQGYINSTACRSSTHTCNTAIAAFIQYVVVTLNPVDICNACVLNPSCDLCTPEPYSGYTRLCSTVEQTCSRNGLVVGPPYTGQQCTSCFMYKSCNDCSRYAYQ